LIRSLPWGKNDKIEVRVPSGWKLVAEQRAHERPAIKDLPAAVLKALAEPDQGLSLRELARTAKKVALIVDDLGRPTPAHLLAPGVLDTLIKCGLKEDQVKVVFSTGTHRPMSKEEMQVKIGAKIFQRLNCQNHDCRNPELLESFGKTSFGTPVFFNRTVAEADLRVLIGTIEPHPQAGFGGGLKNILPGTAGAASIGHNHLILPSPRQWNMIGTLPEQNPMRQDIEEAANMLPGKNFILNTILGPDLAPIALVAGEPVAAHRKGVEIARQLYGYKLPRLLDAIIVSSFPMDQDLRQGVKGVANAPGAIRKGGAIICFLKCERGMEEIKAPAWIPPFGPMRAVLKMLGASGIYAITRRLPKKIPVEARFIINFGLQVLKDYNVMVFSPQLVKETGGRLAEFIFDDQEKMFGRAEKVLGAQTPEACMVAEGGISFPMVEQ